MVSLDGVKVGGTVIPEMKADGAIMDTGTSLITTSMQDAIAINSVSSSLQHPVITLGLARHLACLKEWHSEASKHAYFRTALASCILGPQRRLLHTEGNFRVSSAMLTEH